MPFVSVKVCVLVQGSQCNSFRTFFYIMDIDFNLNSKTDYVKLIPEVIMCENIPFLIKETVKQILLYRTRNIFL